MEWHPSGAAALIFPASGDDDGFPIQIHLWTSSIASWLYRKLWDTYIYLFARDSAHFGASKVSIPPSISVFLPDLSPSLLPFLFYLQVYCCPLLGGIHV